MPRLVWADECEGAAGAPPRADLWGLRRTDRWQPAGELQRYTDDPANACHDGEGHLVLRALRNAGRYTSARLSARHSTSPKLFRYGLFAARVKVPTGAGAWPAWWLLGEDDRYGWPGCGEVDIMEAPSAPGTAGQIHQGTHSPAGARATHAHAAGAGQVSVGVPPSTGDWGARFHVYALDWRPGRMAFFIDGRPTGEVTRQQVESRGGDWPFERRPQSPVINVAVGGWAGRPGDWTEQSMLVDWVRVYG